MYYWYFSDYSTLFTSNNKITTQQPKLPMSTSAFFAGAFRRISA
jgi:hypothetical protein